MAVSYSKGIKYFYPRSPCGERRDCAQYCTHAREISIHALLAESDLRQNRHRRKSKDISIHALLAESDGRRRRRLRHCPAISIHALLAESDSKSAQNSGALFAHMKQIL